MEFMISSTSVLFEPKRGSLWGAGCSQIGWFHFTRKCKLFSPVPGGSPSRDSETHQIELLASGTIIEKLYNSSFHKYIPLETHAFGLSFLGFGNVICYVILEFMALEEVGHTPSLKNGPAICPDIRIFKVFVWKFSLTLRNGPHPSASCIGDIGVRTAISWKQIPWVMTKSIKIILNGIPTDYAVWCMVYGPLFVITYFVPTWLYELYKLFNPVHPYTSLYSATRLGSCHCWCRNTRCGREETVLWRLPAWICMILYHAYLTSNISIVEKDYMQ